MAVHIVTDSMACLPQTYVGEHGVTVVPLKVSLDGEYVRDGIDISNDEFYRRLEWREPKGGARSHLPMSSLLPTVPFWSAIRLQTSCRCMSAHTCRAHSIPLRSRATWWARTMCILWTP